MIIYGFFEQQKLLLIRFEGEIPEKELIEFIPFIIEKANENSIKYVIDDLRNAIFNFDLKSLEKVIEVHYSSAAYYSDIKEVIIIDTILQTTYSVLLSEKLKLIKSDTIICSTLTCAIKSLGLNIDEPELENKIKNLKFQFKTLRNE